MEPTVAQSLIRNGIGESPGAQTWADLGAGGGLFTNALLALLPASSIVYAVDKELEVRPIDNRIRTVVADFVRDDLNLPPLDGVLMANSIHYVKEKKPFFAKLQAMIRPDGRLVIVEYDRRITNPWVPFPMAFADLTTLATDLSFRRVTKLAEHPSQFGGSLYAALVEF